MKTSSAAGRWGVNLAIAVVAAAALNGVLAIAGAWGESLSTSPAGVLLTGTFLTFMYLVFIPAFAALFLMELAMRRATTRGRALAAAISGSIGATYVVLLAGMWHFVEAPAALGAYVAAAVVGAAYGLLIRLPPAADPNT